MYIIIVLCITIIIFSLLSSYKIETFVNIEEQNDTIKTPNNYVCKNFIEDSIRKGKLDWNSDFLPEEDKMLSSLKTTVDVRYVADIHEQFSKNSCIIPDEHKHLFGFDQNCKMTSKEGKTYELPIVKKPIIPGGCMIDFSNDGKYKNQEKFKLLLHDMHMHFNDDYLKQIDHLRAVLDFVRKQIDLVDEFESVSQNDKADYDNYCNAFLIKRISESFKTKIENEESNIKTNMFEEIQQEIPGEYRDTLDFQRNDMDDTLKEMNVKEIANEKAQKEESRHQCQSTKYDKMKENYEKTNAEYNRKLETTWKYTTAISYMNGNLDKIKSKIAELQQLRNKLSEYK